MTLNIVLFAGAGASFATSADKFPTTRKFFERLPKTISSDPFFVSLSQHLKKKANDTTLDIEKILWELSDISSVCHKLTHTGSFFPTIMQPHFGKNQLKMNPSQNWGSAPAISGHLINACSKLRDQINENVYNLYAEEPTSDDLEKSWLPLLRVLSDLGSKTDVFTTNYDLIIECAFNKIEQEYSKVITQNGWSGGVTRHLDTTLWEESSHAYDIMLTKLHGSVNWTNHNGRIIVGDPTFKGSHDKHSIIYPGYKSSPEGGIYAKFHDHFSSRLEECDCIIFLGFAFRDEYINLLCERNIPQNTPVIVIDPSEEINAPFEAGQWRHVKNGFDHNSVEQVVDILQEILEKNGT